VREAIELELVLSQAHWNLEPPALYEEAIRRREARLACSGALVAYTGRHTGRSPNDKFIVKDPSSADKVWWGPVNTPISPEQFDQLYERLCDYLKKKKVFVQDLEVCAAPRYRLPLRVITEYAWHSLFARNLFLRTRRDNPEITVICAPSFRAVPERDGTRSETFIILHLAKKIILIGGTAYAGEIKKSVFTLLNYLLPQQGVLPMHCSANQGQDGQTALFFGLSGTGKTTLSTDPDRPLIGDDEHGWSDEGVFISRAAATPQSSGCAATPSRRSITRCINLARSWRTSSWKSQPEPFASMTRLSRRTRARPTPSSSCPTSSRRAPGPIPTRSSSWRMMRLACCPLSRSCGTIK
jgi:ATP-dependent phosphoenolpyruvate carboxykinase